jgi:plasmid stability protein
MPQLLVRNVEESVVRKLRRRAAAHGVSVEEEHRRVLKEALGRPETMKPSLMKFLLTGSVAPTVELDLSRSRDVEAHRDVKL